MSNPRDRQSPNDAITSALGAIRSAPHVLTSTIGTTPSNISSLGIDDAASLNGTRRVRLLNKHASQYVGLLIQELDDGDTLTISDAIQVAPGQSLELPVGAHMRLSIVASGASTDFNLTVHDLL